MAFSLTNVRNYGSEPVINKLKPTTGQRITLKNCRLNELYIWASLHSRVTLVSGYPFRYLSIAHNVDVHRQVKDRWYTVFALDK